MKCNCIKWRRLKLVGLPAWGGAWGAVSCAAVGTEGSGFSGACWATVPTALVAPRVSASPDPTSMPWKCPETSARRSAPGRPSGRPRAVRTRGADAPGFPAPLRAPLPGAAGTSRWKDALSRTEFANRGAARGGARARSRRRETETLASAWPRPRGPGHLERNQRCPPRGLEKGRFFPLSVYPRFQSQQSVTTGHRTFSKNKRSLGPAGGARAGGRAADAPAAPGPAQPPWLPEVPARAALWRPQVPDPGSARTGSGPRAGRGLPPQAGRFLQRTALAMSIPLPEAPGRSPRGSRVPSGSCEGLSPHPRCFTRRGPRHPRLLPAAGLPYPREQTHGSSLFGGDPASQERGGRWRLPPQLWDPGILATYPLCSRGQLRDPVPSGRGHSPSQTRRGH